jgi:hypothetical protein
MVVQLAKENKNFGRGMSGRGMSYCSSDQGTNKEVDGQRIWKVRP